MGDDFCSGFVTWLPSLKEQQEVPLADCSTQCPRQTYKGLGNGLSRDISDRVCHQSRCEICLQRNTTWLLLLHETLFLSNTYIHVHTHVHTHAHIDTLCSRFCHHSKIYTFLYFVFAELLRTLFPYINRLFWLFYSEKF